MQELKFKGWDKLNKKMISHFLISSSGEFFCVRDPMLPIGDSYGFSDLIP